MVTTGAVAEGQVWRKEGTEIHVERIFDDTATQGQVVEFRVCTLTPRVCGLTTMVTGIGTFEEEMERRGYRLSPPPTPEVGGSFDRYSELSRRTSQWRDADGAERDNALVCAALGLAGEAGELANLVKKRQYHKESIDPEDIMDEAGDVLWYLSDFLQTFGYERLSDVAQRNVDKLARRWPEGFKEGDRD